MPQITWGNDPSIQPFELKGKKITDMYHEACNSIVLEFADGTKYRIRSDQEGQMKLIKL